MPEGARAAAHLKIGRLVAAATPAEAIEENVFENGERRRSGRASDPERRRRQHGGFRDCTSQGGQSRDLIARNDLHAGEALLGAVQPSLRVQLFELRLTGGGEADSCFSVGLHGDR